MPTIFIIGASRGIGLECVRQYHADGWRVIATARDEAGLARAKAAGAETIQLDVARSESNAALASKIGNERFDVALYVAGVMSRGQASTPPEADKFDHIMRTNVLGAMQLIPTVTPRVAATQGKFVFITSGMGSIAEADSSYGWVYRASKAALNMTVHSAQHDYPDAILAVMNPGWVKTDMGGMSAPITVEQSVSGMKKVIASLTRKDQGSFVSYDGRRIPW